MERYADEVEKIVKKIAYMGVRDLERYATAYYVSENNKEIDPGEIATKIVELKPHISPSEAGKAVEFVAKLKSSLSDS